MRMFACWLIYEQCEPLLVVHALRTAQHRRRHSMRHTQPHEQFGSKDTETETEQQSRTR